MNILVIFADQQHKYALGAVDSQFITPNLDTLCKEGVLFENGYSNNPVCGPYRGCLMTGSYTNHCKVINNGDPLPDHLPSMAQILLDHGYMTGFTGKWHLGGNGATPIPENIRGGFERFIGYQCYNGFEPKPPYNNAVVFFDENNQPHQFDKHRTDATTDLAISQLNEMIASGKPFFQLVGYQAPHYPEQPSEAFAKLYEGKIFDKTPDFTEVDPYTPTYSPFSPRPFENCPDYQRYGGDMDKYQQLYAGLVSQVDAGVGRIIENLKQQGVYEDTLILYTADHGDMQGSHGLKNKCLPFEKSCGVPFVAKYPNGCKNVRSAAPVSGIDIFPTVLEAAGITDIKADGIPLIPILTGQGKLARNYIAVESTIPNNNEPEWSDIRYWRMLRDEQYKLVVSSENNEPCFLFDMQSDPYELHNLINDPTYAKRIEQMNALLQQELN